MLMDLVRENIKTLEAYSSARDEFQGNDAVFLDANENPFGTLNRYPDPYQTKLKARLSRVKKIPPKNIFIGNGSDEVIDLLIRVFCEPGLDKIMIFPPTYGMYKVTASINNIGSIEVPLDTDFQLDIENTKLKIAKENPKVVFFCSPNNPTGNHLDGIAEILKDFKGVACIDEAYVDFSERQSWVHHIHQYPNLIVTQTFSKAWGLAGARVGVAYAQADIINLMGKIKPPYNVSRLNQEAALAALENKFEFDKNLRILKKERQGLINALNKLNTIKKVYPTDANFILIEVEKATAIYNRLIRHNLIIRDRSKLIDNTLRITVGTPEENKKLLNELNAL